MKYLLSFLSIYLCQVTVAQTIENIDSLKQMIDQTRNFDTISISHNHKGTNKPIRIQAYLKGDTLLKTIAYYVNSSRQRITYYERISTGYSSPILVIDVDSMNQTVLLQVYGNGNDVIKSSILSPLEEQEAKQPSSILQNANFSTEIGFALVDRKAEKYTFTGKLVKAVPLTPGCGIIAWALVQKFEVINTSFPDYPNKYVLIVQTCPEFLGKGFFEKGSIYTISVATNSGVTFSYVVNNRYKKENLPMFWARQIKKTK